MRPIQTAEVRADKVRSVAASLRAHPDVTVDRAVINANDGDILAGIRVLYLGRLLILTNSCTGAFCVLRLGSLSRAQATTFEEILVSAGGRIADDDDADPIELAKLRARQARAENSQT